MNELCSILTNEGVVIILIFFYFKGTSQHFPRISRIIPQMIELCPILSCHKKRVAIFFSSSGNEPAKITHSSDISEVMSLMNEVFPFFFFLIR